MREHAHAPERGLHAKPGRRHNPPGDRPSIRVLLLRDGLLVHSWYGTRHLRAPATQKRCAATPRKVGHRPQCCLECATTPTLVVWWHGDSYRPSCGASHGPSCGPRCLDNSWHTLRLAARSACQCCALTSLKEAAATQRSASAGRCESLRAMQHVRVAGLVTGNASLAATARRDRERACQQELAPPNDLLRNRASA